MNTPRQQQHDGSGSHPTTPTSWDGDQMLHIYVCDYLRKRGYSQAALALRLEAGLEPDRKVPIDAPQSLLFEWWVVFWEVFASRALDYPTAAAGSISADAQTYTQYRPPGLPQARTVALGGPSPQTSYPSGVHQIRASGLATFPNTALNRQLSQVGSTSLNRRTERPEAASSMQAGGGAHTRASPPEQQDSQQQPPRRASITKLSQLDLDASHKLGLARPAGRTVIQQCMEMMDLGAKQIDNLTDQEKRALAKRVNRLQTAQNDAQMSLARLHGLQPPKPLGARQAQGPSMVASTTTDAYGDLAGRKRKESPNADADRSRVVVGSGTSHGPGPSQGQMQPQLGAAQPIRRLSYAALTAIPNATSPLTPSSAGGGMPFSQVSLHPMLQHSPASDAPTPSAMNPPTRRPSVFGTVKSVALPASSPQKLSMHASGLAGSSVSPINEWQAFDYPASQYLQQQQQQRPVVMPSSLDPQVQQHPPAFQNGGRYAMHQTFSGLPSGSANVRPLPPQAMTVGPKDVAAPPLHLLKPSVFGSATGGEKGGSDGYATSAAALNEMVLQQQQQQQQGSAPPTPFADLEYDFNVLLSNSTRLGREESAASARQMGDVNGS